jgi:hypothetical protein
MASRNGASSGWRSGGKIRHNLAMARYAKGFHTKLRLQYHLVWIPKYRRLVLQGKIAIRLRNLMYVACKMNGWWISEEEFYLMLKAIVIDDTRPFSEKLRD